MIFCRKILPFNQKLYRLLTFHVPITICRSKFLTGYRSFHTDNYPSIKSNVDKYSNEFKVIYYLPLKCIDLFIFN